MKSHKKLHGQVSDSLDAMIRLALQEEVRVAKQSQRWKQIKARVWRIKQARLIESTSQETIFTRPPLPLSVSTNMLYFSIVDSALQMIK